VIIGSNSARTSASDDDEACDQTLIVIVIKNKKNCHHVDGHSYSDYDDCHRHLFQPHPQICDQSGWKCGRDSKPKQLKVEAAC